MCEQINAVSLAQCTKPLNKWTELDIYDMDQKTKAAKVQLKEMPTWDMSCYLLCTIYYANSSFCISNI